MFIAKVTGSLVATQKVDTMVGHKLLIDQREQRVRARYPRVNCDFPSRHLTPLPGVAD